MNTVQLRDEIFNQALNAVSHAYSAAAAKEKGLLADEQFHREIQDNHLAQIRILLLELVEVAST